MNKIILGILFCAILVMPYTCFADKASTGSESAIRNPQSEIDPISLAKPAIRLFAGADLPQYSVQAIVVDRRGYLWVGTQSGAAYYNGQKWNVVNMPNRSASNFIRAIFVSSSGSLWFGTEGGGAL